MKKILFASSKEDRFNEVKKAFSKKGVYEVLDSDSKDKTLEIVSNQFITLVVIDEALTDISGFDLCQEIIKINAMTNTTILSSLPDNQFHDTTEGLGVLMKLPLTPSMDDGVKLEKYLDKIINPL